MRHIPLAATTFLLLLLTGCSHAADEAMAKQAARSGVWAITSSGLSEIAQYGAETLDPFSQEIQFKFDHPIVQVAAPLGFVTNLPTASMSDAKVFLLPTLEAGHWHRYFVDGADSKPIPSSADAISGSIYKVIPELPGTPAGFLCLWVKMPGGTEDRMYAVRLK